MYSNCLGMSASSQSCGIHLFAPLSQCGTVNSGFATPEALDSFDKKTQNKKKRCFTAILHGLHIICHNKGIEISSLYTKYDGMPTAMDRTVSYSVLDRHIFRVDLWEFCMEHYKIVTNWQLNHMKTVDIISTEELDHTAARICLYSDSSWSKNFVLNCATTVNSHSAKLVRFINANKSGEHVLANRLFVFNAAMWRKTFTGTDDYDFSEAVQFIPLEHDDCFELSLLLIPVSHEDGHWSLLAVYPLQREIHYLNSRLMSEDYRKSTLENAMKFLFDLHLHQNFKPLLNIGDWKLFYPDPWKPPQEQHEVGDFGMYYMLKFMDCLAEHLCVKWVYDNEENALRSIADYRGYIALCMVSGRVLELNEVL